MEAIERDPATPERVGQPRSQGPQPAPQPGDAGELLDETGAALFPQHGAGAIGALVSALSRMSRVEQGRFNIDFELGRPLMRRLGVFRPFLGAAIGVALYFLLASGLLDIEVEPANEPYYYGFAAFLAGFSERFATVILGAGEQRLAPRKEEEKEEEKAPEQKT